MAKFFIDRPVFAWVIAIIIMLAGGMALRVLPVAQYPDIAPTTVTVAATYPGASAEAVENAVTQVIEQQLTGLDGLDYISSSSNSNGTASITLSFEPGTDPDIAQVQTQNKISLATPLLPEQVQRQGVSVSKAAGGFLLVTAVYSPNGTYNQTDLGDYVRSNIYDTVSRLEGVGSVQVFGSQYAMRVWLEPEKLNQYGLTPSDIVQAIQAQNAQIASGALGGAPSVPGQEINVTVTLQSLLTTPEEFRNLLIRTTSAGGSVRLEDVARVELGAQVFAGTEQPVTLCLNQRGEVLLIAGDVVFLVVRFRAQAAAGLGGKAWGSRVSGIGSVAGGEQCSGQAGEAEQFDQVCVHRNVFLSPGVVSGFRPGRSTRLFVGAPADRGFRPDGRPIRR